MNALIVFLAVTTALSQTPSKPAESKRDPVREDFYKNLHTIRDQGTAALAREQARNKKELCAQTDNGYVGLADCLANERKVTEENYKAYLSAIVDVLNLPEPEQVEARSDTDPGKVFEQAEETWQTYRNQQCNSMSAQWNGGFVRVANENCRIALTQLHINELADLYGDLWL